MKYHIHDSYLWRERVPMKRYWWEGLPVLRHLVTKRAAIKLHDARLDLLLDKLGYSFHIAQNTGEMTIVPRRRKRGK